VRVEKDGENIGRQIVVLDAADPAAESTFRSGPLGGTVEGDDGWHSVISTVGGASTR